MRESTPQPVSAVLNLDQAVDEFRQTVRPLMEPGQESEWDGSKVKKKEFAILQAALRLAGECIAILIYQLVLTESVKLAAKARVRGQAGIAYTHQAFKEVGITVIGGVQVRVKTLYKLARQRKAGRGRKRKQGKRGQSHGQGFYPVLGLLGISEGVTPLIRCGVAQAATQSVSLEYARQQMTGWGVHFSIRRISRAFCEVGLQVRAEKLGRFAAGTLPAGTALQGKRVVIGVDGGRVRIRQPKNRGRKRKSGRHGYTGEWKEPKLLTIYVLDEQGRKGVGTDVPGVCDGTLMGEEEFLQILSMYLHELGIATADLIVLTGDGAHWIWDHIPALLHRLGCRPEQITQILDYGHAVEHLSVLAEALFGDTPHSKGWARQWARRLKQGRAGALLTEVSRFLAKQELHDPKIAQREYNYFHNHHANAARPELAEGRLEYPRFQKQKLPIGSGAVESLIRQVVNLRLKGCGKFWLMETAEAFLHARCQWAAHLWSDFCDAVLTFGLAPVVLTI